MYNEMLPAIKDNFERAKQYRSTDDQVANILTKWRQKYEKSYGVGV